MVIDTVERRGNQRIVTTQGGRTHFWLRWNGDRLPVSDLSVEGFAVSVATAPASDQPFEFRLERDDAGEGVRGLAQVVNYASAVEGGQAGCRFVELSPAARELIAAWLADHVVGAAAVPLTVAEATGIVLGPSII